MTNPTPLADADLERLQNLLEALPPPLEPLDISAIDGFLCGVLLQPTPVGTTRWLPHVTDIEARPAPPGPALDELQALVRRRHAELERAIAARDWFDPWIFDADADADAEEEADAEAEAEADDATDGAHDAGATTDAQPGPAAGKGRTGAAAPAEEADNADADAGGVTASVLPWVAGFAAAMDAFPALMDLDAPALVEPLALLYMHFDPEDLDDAEALAAVIETLEPPADLSEAVQDLVRALMLIADVTRPRAKQPAKAGTPKRHGAGGKKTSRERTPPPARHGPAPKKPGR